MEILEFIENFRCGLGQFTKKESGIVQQLFENGCCYYFANIVILFLYPAIVFMVLYRLSIIS